MILVVMTLIVTGDRGSGKTTVLHDLIRLRPDLGCGGILALQERDHTTGSRRVVTAVDIAGGDRWPLAHRSDQPADPKAHVRIGPFLFLRSAIDRAAAVVAAETHRPGGPVIIDEVGPLELRSHDGFWPVIPDAITSVRTTLFVVRPSLIDHFTTVLAEHGAPPPTIFAVDSYPREARTGALLDALGISP